MKRNTTAFKKAKELIRKHQYVKDSDWSEAQPDTDRENEIIDNQGWDAFAEWHLGIHESENEETKGRYGFPYGDFRRVHYSALNAIKQRAAQNDYSDIADAADELLDLYEQEST